jgi:glucosamine--fructose-6-phosphate aminotransferase (isomerizing)
VTTLFETELREQPSVLARLLREGRGPAEAIAARLRERRVRFAVLAARGSSDNAARYAQYVFGVHNGLVAALATPSAFTHYGARPSLQDSLVIGISQSGQSPDIVQVLREGRAQGAFTLAVTNEPASPLATAAEAVFPLRAGKEKAVAATKTYTAQVLAVAMLSAALKGDERLWLDLASVPDLAETAIARNLPNVGAAEALREHSRLVVVGRGYNLSTAFEITLKVKETTGVMADGYSSADFLHGPKAILDRHLPVLAVAPGPRVFDDLDGLVRLTRDNGAPLVAISDRQDLLSQADIAMPLPAMPEWLSPIVAVMPGQIFALGLSLARGMQPDAPPGLSKVTHTR